MFEFGINLSKMLYDEWYVFRDTKMGDLLLVEMVKIKKKFEEKIGLDMIARFNENWISNIKDSDLEEKVVNLKEYLVLVYLNVEYQQCKNSLIRISFSNFCDQFGWEMERSIKNFFVNSLNNLWKREFIVKKSKNMITKNRLITSLTFEKDGTLVKVNPDVFDNFCVFPLFESKNYLKISPVKEICNLLVKKKNENLKKTSNKTHKDEIVCCLILLNKIDGMSGTFPLNIPKTLRAKKGLIDSLNFICDLFIEYKYLKTYKWNRVDKNTNVLCLVKEKETCLFFSDL
jgi:hypothetical protein